MTVGAARGRPQRGRALLLLVAAVAAVLGALWAAAPASAHAVLVSSSPADGSRLSTAPAAVDLTFDEHIQLVPGAAKVISASGARADTGRAHLSAAGTGIVIPLKASLPKGSYTATWRVVSADTHIVSGSITFGVGQAAAATPASAATAVSGLDVAAETAQGLGYLGVILAFGGVAMGAVLWPGALRRTRVRVGVWGGWAVLVAGGLAEFLVQGPRAQASDWLGVLRFVDLGQTLHSSYGVALLVRVALLFALAALAPALLGARSRPRSAVAVSALVLATGVLVTIALGGHAASGTDAGIATVAAALHLASMAVWCGGLFVLLVGVLPGLADPLAAIATLRRWSLIAFVAVVVLIVSGEYQAWRQLTPLPSLWSTRYGVTLLIKLALVCAALLVALVAQRALLGRHLTTGQEAPVDAPRVLRAVRRSVRVESAIVVAVVAATTVLVSEAPPSSTYGPAAELSAALGPDRVLVHVDPTRHGPERFTFRPVDAHGAPLHLQTLAVTLSSAQNDIAAVDLTVVRGPGDEWRTTGAVLPLAGVWTVTLDASVTTSVGYAGQVSYQVW